MRKMKDSGIEWIGMIPEGWEKLFLGQCYQERKKRNSDGQVTNVLSLSYGRIIRRNVENNMGLLPESFNTYNVVVPGNIVLRFTDLQNDTRSLRTGLVNEKGIITSAYLTLESKCELDPRFNHYLLHSYDTTKVFYGMGDGVRQNLKFTELAKLPLLVPSLPEQQRIADYLDRKCAKIDDTIDKQRVVIEKLKAYKQSVITHAVTKGLNPKAPMKDSGIEWIGKIPEGIKVSRIGMLYKSILGKMVASGKVNQDDTFEKYLCALNVHFDGIDLETAKEMWFSPEEKAQYQLRQGDLLIVEGGAGAGGSYIFDSDTDRPYYIQNSIHLVRPIGNASNRYLYFWLFSLVSRSYIDFVSNKATIPHFTKEKLLFAPIVVFPPTEQCQIADYLDKKCADIDTAIAKKEALIEKLAAYKKSLIYECVTGKREVV